jgi:hypothetical protein
VNILGRSISKRELDRGTGHLQQIGGTRHFELSSGRAKGMRGIEVNTGRGPDIANYIFRVTNLVYLAPGGVTHPAFCNPAGLEWLNTFFGGLLTTCWMTCFGDPERDGEKELGLHKHYAGLAAAVIQDNSRTDSLSYLNKWKMLHEGDRGVFRRDSEGARTEKE